MQNLTRPQRAALELVILLLPPAYRTRYREEWVGDLLEGTVLGIAARSTLWGAAKIAVKHRGRWFGGALVGRAGGPAAAVCWVAVVAVEAVIPAAGVLLVLAWLWWGVAILVRGASDGRRVAAVAGRRLLLVGGTALVTSVVAAAGAFFLWGVAFGAVDAAQPVPPITRWTAPLLGLTLIAAAIFVATVVGALYREGPAVRRGATISPGREAAGGDGSPSGQ